MNIDVVALRRALKKVPAGHTVKMNIFGKISMYNKAGEYVGYIDPHHCRVREGYQPMPKAQNRLVKLLLLFAAVSVGAGMLTGCSFGVYSGEKSTLVGIELGTKSAFEGLVHHRDKDTFDLSIQSRSKDSSEGLSAIVEGVVRGVK